MEIGNQLLKFSTAQPLAITETDGKQHYFFYAHNEITPVYQFENQKLKKIIPGLKSSFTIKDSDKKEIIITTLTRQQALNFYQWKNGFCITEATLINDNGSISLQSRSNNFKYIVSKNSSLNNKSLNTKTTNYGLFREHNVTLQEASIEYEINKINNQKYTFDIKQNQFSEHLSDIIIDIDYVGDNAVAFIDGKMINDHLYYGNSWQIGLKQYIQEIDKNGIYFYFRPMYKDASYLIDFDKDKIPNFEGKTVCEVKNFRIIPEYQIKF